jgi:Ran GTPase-activating protein (RanGAP) involved in mRNA processing and transport
MMKNDFVNKNCTQLSLWGNEITSVGASFLADGLQNNTILEQMYLSNNCISDMGVYSLTKILSANNSTLKLFDIGTNGITDVGAQYLAEMLKTNTTLSLLALSGNKINDRGIQLLANALTYHNTSLEELYLCRNTFVCASTIDILIDMLLHNQSLKKLYLYYCSLSEVDKERLNEIANSKDEFVLYV